MHIYRREYYRSDRTYELELTPGLIAELNTYLLLHTKTPIQTITDKMVVDIFNSDWHTTRLGEIEFNDGEKIDLALFIWDWFSDELYDSGVMTQGDEDGTDEEVWGEIF